MSKIAIIDYGIGNLYSVVKALEHVAGPADRVFTTSNPEVIDTCDRAVFPGQGAAQDCMQALKVHGLEEVVLSAARNKPFLGICMGMQVLMRDSEENQGTGCLALYEGSVKYFGDHVSVGAGTDRYKVPHMGWNAVRQDQAHPLWEGIAPSSYFYFVHSYFVACEDAALVAGTTDYGLPFTSAIAKDNVFAMQCHPEKSAGAGLKLLSNFIRWDGESGCH
ncbi:MAG: imidazole glycerol phosphate synthase subunit HisH [Proteobacteria bacterium]|nr:imidazole glycerol phosphate synthase subunit HisH [Pseudomonadota bacterium]